MNVKFHKTVLKPKKKNLNKQIVQTVRTVDPTTDPDKVCRANKFLKDRGINMVKGVYGSPTVS